MVASKTTRRVARRDDAERDLCCLNSREPSAARAAITTTMLCEFSRRPRTTSQHAQRCLAVAHRDARRRVKRHTKSRADGVGAGARRLDHRADSSRGLDHLARTSRAWPPAHNGRDDAAAKPWPMTTLRGIACPVAANSRRGANRHPLAREREPGTLDGFRLAPKPSAHRRPGSRPPPPSRPGANTVNGIAPSLARTGRPRREDLDGSASTAGEQVGGDATSLTLPPGGAHGLYRTVDARKATKAAISNT